MFHNLFPPKVLGQSPGPSSSRPSWIPKECENPPKTDIKKCCSILPNLGNEKSKKCWAKSKVPKDGMCSSIDCTLKNIGLLKNGTFDAETAKKSIAAMKKDKQWTSEVS